MNLIDKKCIIFDVDGVLVDSEALSCGALHQILMEELAIDIGHDFSPVLGTSNQHAIKYYADKFDVNIDVTEINRLTELKDNRYLQLADTQLSTFEYLETFINKWIDQGKQLTVASSGSLNKIKFSLEKVKLLNYFSLLNSSEEVQHGKPAPDLFELAMSRMKRSADECVVIEDSLLGVKAARNAGIDVLGFVGSFNSQQLKEEGAFPFSSYKELLEWIE
ncbi:MAG: HAD family phosphatase [Candidatus Heimdallarchaeota archaeon]|nr:HAD family phosphatase [Candidatus Heimdallarchaeota archaeon]